MAKRKGSKRGTAAKVVTTEQLEVILNVLNAIVGHADRVAGKARLGVIAARDLLERKGVFSEEEWDAAVARVEREQAMLFALDPDVQSAMDEARRLLESEESADEGSQDSMAAPTIDDARKFLNSHGHAFQSAVIGRARELFCVGRSDWVLEVAELPVATTGETRADFILRSRDRKVFLAAECKRPYPARANWCFVRAPYTRRNATDNEGVVFQEVPFHQGYVSSPKVMVRAWRDACHHGFELHSDDPGDGTGRGRSAIEEAAAQVLRGMNGLIDHIFRSWAPPEPGPGSTVFMPAIFTTAQLFMVQGDLAEADLRTGKLPAAWGSMATVPWLWFNYNQSPSLRHRLVIAPSGFDLSAALHAEFTRSIAVIGPDGIDAFLEANPFGLLNKGA